MKYTFWMKSVTMNRLAGVDESSRERHFNKDLMKKSKL
jgi:hypothetical protein